MPSRRVEARVDAADAARIDAFARASNGSSTRTPSDAIRALLRLGLDAAAQPRLFDERWLDLEERLARIERVLDALGLCVAANPALAAWLLGQTRHGRDEAARERLAEAIDLLVQADWDERCRARGIPRPRYVRRPRRQPIGEAAAKPSRKVRRAMLRLPETSWERVLALALRMDQPPLVALRHLVEMGIHVAEAERWRDDIDRLLESSRRIEVQLDEIGALATAPAAVVVHLWRREKGFTDEWEQVVLNELTEAAHATWMNIQAGPPEPAPDAPLNDSEDDEDPPARRRKRGA